MSPVLVDTCGWIEWLTDGVLAEAFAPCLAEPTALIVPTLLQFELYRWICRERDEALALDIIGLTQLGRVVPLDTPLALHAAELARTHRLALADAVMYASARQEGCPLVTADRHFAGLADVIYLPKSSPEPGV